MPSFGPISSAPIGAQSQSDGGTPPDGGGAVAATSVTVTVQNRAGALALNQTVSLSFFPTLTGAMGAPAYQSPAASTNGAGVLTFSIAGLTSMLAGQYGSLLLSNADGSITSLTKVVVA